MPLLPDWIAHALLYRKEIAGGAFSITGAAALIMRPGSVLQFRRANLRNHEMSLLFLGWLFVSSSLLCPIESMSLHLSRIASTPIMTSTIVANPAPSSKKTNPFENAKRASKLTFAAYVASLLLAAGLTWLAGRSADSVAELAQAEANRRIAESNAAAELARSEAARANEGAAKADEQAAYANERATKLENDNLTLQGKVASLQANVTVAAKEVAGLQIRAASAEQAAAEATQKAAEADANRLKLELAMEPRSVGKTYIADQELALFDGVKVLIAYTPDEDAPSLAHQIRFLVQSDLVHWNMLDIQPISTVKWASEGAKWVASVMPGIHLLTTIGDGRLWDSREMRAAKVLAWHLRANNLAARVETPTTDEAWPVDADRDAVLIVVGRKPQDYWTDKASARQLESIERQEKNVPAAARYLTPDRLQWLEKNQKEREESRREEDAKYDEEHDRIIQEERHRQRSKQ